ncbi:hypothetical protein A2865_03535 [Candidatus Woesebacteria bacterium RIFCSPHIGHO2_01_FULL_39_17]|uniref:DUF4446 domain-containing protein n=3 Tax=Candidatus Woeseibacteriota TaxID=1752722 RepID=A0A0G0NDW5_9BACT|nr:MAG: hypothetical protein US72_C0007G0023 [Microgenomates group bacterium GW2011_GWC1_38_12]KKQ93776.1 MAG: hypothetical protein UT19_C0007G0020 [Candidatus Woesebacteria bacterium GW2011_GWB1_39_10b]KKR14339.1 MAG: hypothetical protein UT40_C0002G0018 [Candidatus Woesebacteria bacterium GW2011_GWA1_39_21b]OGM23604.1 MAG: hypothetical protein A2865_03535 [Candidatus Woesebacteria bacterium RIFCSPHIGHO2_01_FULL_39_17]
MFESIIYPGLFVTRSMEAVFFVLAGFFVWILILSIATFWVVRFFKRLSSGVDRGNLVNILEEVIRREKINAKNLKDLRSNFFALEENSRFHIQKVGLVRFNPFRELGGDHSFSLALLNAKDTGVVITGLHTRERTRVYVKDIKKGKSELELSEEEKRALKRAQKVKV